MLPLRSFKPSAIVRTFHFLKKKGKKHCKLNMNMLRSILTCTLCLVLEGRWIHTVCVQCVCRIYMLHSFLFQININFLNWIERKPLKSSGRGIISKKLYNIVYMYVWMPRRERQPLAFLELPYTAAFPTHCTNKDNAILRRLEWSRCPLAHKYLLCVCVRKMAFLLLLIYFFFNWISDISRHPSAD